MRPVNSQVTNVGIAGKWRIYARRPRQSPVEITYFRGAPTTVGAFSFSDPGGSKQGSLTFPKITMWDVLGVGDLFWLTKDTDFDIVWDGAYPAGYEAELGKYAWEGYSVSFDFSTSNGLTLGLVGAIQQMDNYLAKPAYPTRPMPYEWAIAQCFRGKSDLRLKPLRVEFPIWWATRYTAPPKNTRPYLIPTHVVPGQRWTGLVTRQTGSWDPSFSSYIQQMLTSMYTERGRFTLDVRRHRAPVLFHQDTPIEASDAQLVIDPVTPGVECSFNVDWSQSLNVAYGQGTSLSGQGFTGMVITHDGARTTYEPLAALRQVHPQEDDNGWLEPERMRKEVLLQVQQGLSLDQARKVGQAHLARFSDPGVTGTITLTTDPLYKGNVLPRALIKAGMSVRLPGIFGSTPGLLLHITEVSHDFANATSTLSVDSKFRDALTVDEVKIRGRDALSITRQLIGGQYAPPVPDMLLPWNYAEGSGYIPSGPHHSSKPLFDGMPDDIQFPWTEWTTQRPPRDKSWAKCYMRIGPKNAANSDFNWGVRFGSDGTRLGFPIKMAQAGQIRQLQLAAFDEDGRLLPVRFHFSLYSNRGVNVASMPRITDADIGAGEDGYKVGQRYPFFTKAWERYKVDGTQVQTEDPVSVSSAGLIRAWGTRHEPAGMWPGSRSAGTAPTGMLVDETPWEFSTMENVGLAFNPHAPQQNSPDAGFLYCMIYCDDQLTQPVYFAGRMFRTEPGSTV